VHGRDSSLVTNLDAGSQLFASSVGLPFIPPEAIRGCNTMSGFEVIGAVAAAGQFIEQTIAIAKLIHAVRGKVRDAPAEIQQWHDELETLGAIAS